MTHGMILSGLPSLDDALGGLLCGRVHLVTGGPGSGKTAVALRFLWSALERGETGLLVTLGSGSDLKALAARLGMDLDRHVRANRLLLLRYRDEFTNRLSYTARPAIVLQHLDRFVEQLAPKRVVIDTMSPFLADGTASGEGVSALTQWLERCGGTSVVTCADSVAGGYDRRLETMVQRAAAIIQLERTRRDAFEAEVVTARYDTRASLATFTFAELAVGESRPRRSEVALPERPGRDLLYAHTAGSPSHELVALVRGSPHTANVTLRRAASASHPPSVRDAGGIVVEVDRRSAPLALQLVPAMARREPAGALVVIARSPIRSLDRARLLESGADDVLASDMSSAEILARLDRALERGHQRRDLASLSAPHVPLQRVITQGATRALHPGELAQALDASAPLGGGTLFGLRLTHGADGETLQQLVSIVLRAARVESGDLVAVAGDTVVVRLRGTRRDETAPFLERVRARWSVVGTGTLRGEPLSRIEDASMVPQPSAAPLVSIVQ